MTGLAIFVAGMIVGGSLGIVGVALVVAFDRPDCDGCDDPDHCAGCDDAEAGMTDWLPVFVVTACSAATLVVGWLLGAQHERENPRHHDRWDWHA